MLGNQDLRHLQQCELIIANEIKRICEKNNIKYFIVGGTALGAIRHGGFIPWDDDMDIGMERAEYERFCSVCKKDLKSEFVLQTWDTDETYPFSYGKVRLKDTRVEELFAASDKKSNAGIFVDIFPFDHAPDLRKERERQEKCYFFYKRALWIKKGYGKNILGQGWKQKIKYAIFSCICRLIPYRLLKKKFKTILTMYNQSSTEWIVTDSVYSYEKNSIKCSWVKDLKSTSFENYEFPIFAAHEEYLTHLYGNYMELPPLEKRHSHDIQNVHFGRY